jgi:hypothetical protein
MTVDRAARTVLCVGLLVLLSGCVNTLPDQDRRIRVTPSVAKIPADFLWKEYQVDARAADRKYWGKAIEVSGTVTRAEANDSGGPSRSYLFFGLTDPFGVRANLLDDDADEILKSTQPGQRVRLKCFCAGLNGHVVLKSCVKG